MLLALALIWRTVLLNNEITSLLLALGNAISVLNSRRWLRPSSKSINALASKACQTGVRDLAKAIEIIRSRPAKTVVKKVPNGRVQGLDLGEIGFRDFLFRIKKSRMWQKYRFLYYIWLPYMKKALTLNDTCKANTCLGDVDRAKLA